VIGAGLSGLCAADWLLNRKSERWKVTVLEARERLGGRVHSFRFPEAPDLVCELGGEWIGLDHDHMLRLCSRFKIKPEWHRYDFSFLERGQIVNRYKAGADPFSKKARDAYHAFSKEYKRHRNNPNWKKLLDLRDWWTVLRDHGFPTQDLLRRDLMDSTDFGESIRQTGGYSAAAEYMQSNSFDEMDKHVPGGNSRIIEGLELDIIKRGGTILTRRQVQLIRQKRLASGACRGVSVRTGFGETIEADFCICTVPARTLTKIHFDPLLDSQWDAAQQLQYCRIQKTVLLYERRFWPKKLFGHGFSCFTEGASDFIFDATQGQNRRQAILCSYAIGDKADDLAASRSEALRQRIDSDLSLMFPGKSLEASAIARYPWQRDEYTEGAYAFYRPGQWFTLWENLVRPHHNVFFAGEHLADDQGFMEGAADSGVEAARDVVRAANGKPWKKRVRR
jgi:monoamine oxidase